VGTFNVIYDVAHYAYVPLLVGQDRLVSANSKLQLSYSLAEAAGPGIAGLLVQWLTAPFALLLDSVSFLLSAFYLSKMRAQVAPVAPVRDEGSMWEGVRLLLTHPLLRTIIGATMLSTFFTDAILGIYILYASQTLHLTPLTLGVLFAVGGLAALPGAMLADRVARHLGRGPTIITGWWLSGAALLLIPLATPATALALLLCYHLASGLTGTIANIHQWSLRQAVTPPALHGRVTAGHRFLVYGAGAVGALSGGLLAEAIGVREALWVCAIAGIGGPLSTMGSPLTRQGLDTTTK
jgi:predicted MFS family arabinose efflux permease